MIFRRRGNSKKGTEILPEEIFLDAHNSPQFDQQQMEGRFEHPISRRVMYGVFITFLLIAVGYCGRLLYLQAVQGDVYAARSKENRLERSLIFSERGVIFDDDRRRLAWNVNGTSSASFFRRRYASTSGMAHLVGYLSYPSKDDSGVYYETQYRGKRGAEKSFDDVLKGQNGLRVREVNAMGEVISQNTVRKPTPGENVQLAADTKLQRKLHELIRTRAQDSGFQGGAGVVMDIETGEVIALTSYPEFNLNVMTNGSDEEINAIQSSAGDPFLNRVTGGAFIPGSIVKPFLAYGALEEEVIGPQDTIVSTGSITVPNPYDEDDPTVFYDWKEHGPVTMRDALAVSSNIYFYKIGGGHKDQEGIGIEGIQRYMRAFGFGTSTDISLSGEVLGTIPGPSWKQKHFEDGTWRVGDTYNTAIGQYGLQVTPIQAVRATAALARNGQLIRPLIREQDSDRARVDRVMEGAPEHFAVVREGMRRAVRTEKGTASGLDVPYTDVAAKTGTAEIGKASVNSWVIGFFPFDDPRYAFTVVMERGPRKNELGGVWVMRRFLDWMKQEVPQYFLPADQPE